MAVTALGLLFALIALFLTSGCAALLPSSQATTKSRWTNYWEARSTFDRIVPFQTTSTDLNALGFDPSAPNVKLLTYLDVIQRFLPNQSIAKEDLDHAVRECIEAKDGCRALELELNEVKGKRLGSVLLDMFGFRRKTHETGWRFKALLLIRNDRVVYKLSSGEPAVDRMEKKVKPLGPLQDVDSLLLRSVSELR